jgi:hypothetical protein
VARLKLLFRHWIHRTDTVQSKSENGIRGREEKLAYFESCSRYCWEQTCFYRIRNNGLLSWRQHSTRGYLGSQDFSALCTKPWEQWHAIRQLGNMLLCGAALAVLLAIGGVEQNLGPRVEAENIAQVLCSGCDRTLKSGIQCDTCGRWFHNSCRK